MNNYRMKVLRNTEEIEVRIMQKTKQKIQQPRKVKFNWMYVFVSFAVLALVIIGTRQLLLDPLKSNSNNPEVTEPPKTNPIDPEVTEPPKTSPINPEVDEVAFVTEMENVEAIEMSYSSADSMVGGTITNEQDIHELMTLLTKLYGQPKGQFSAIENDFKTVYSIAIQEKNYYPTGTIDISEKHLSFNGEYVAISKEDFEQIATSFQKTLVPFSSIGTTFELFGVTLGNDRSGVERLLHGMYTELSQAPEGVLPGDSAIETEQMRIHFSDYDKVSAIKLFERDETYYDALFADAIEAGYAYELKGSDDQKMRYFYWPKSGQLLTMNYADGSNNGVNAWLMHADPNFFYVFDEGLVEKIEPE